MKNVPISPTQQGGPAPTSRPAGRREGVSFEDVKKAAEKLTLEKLPVSLRTVRAELGTGSLSTVQKHLSALRSLNTPIQPEGPSPLSPQVLRALAAEFDRAAAERSSKIEAELRDAQSSLELLVQENEGLRVSEIESADLLEKLRKSHAESTGTVDALRTQVAALSTQLSAAQSNAETVLKGLAVSQEQRHSTEHRAERLESEILAVQNMMSKLRQELLDSRLDGDTGRRAVAALEAQLATKQQLEDHLNAATATGLQNRQKLEEARLRLALLEAERSSQAERTAELKAALARAEENAQRLLEKFFSDTPRPEGVATTNKGLKS